MIMSLCRRLLCSPSVFGTSLLRASIGTNARTRGDLYWAPLRTFKIRKRGWATILLLRVLESRVWINPVHINSIGKRSGSVERNYCIASGRVQSSFRHLNHHRILPVSKRRTSQFIQQVTHACAPVHLPGGYGMVRTWMAEQRPSEGFR